MCVPLPRKLGQAKRTFRVKYDICPLGTLPYTCVIPPPVSCLPVRSRAQTYSPTQGDKNYVSAGRAGSEYVGDIDASRGEPVTPETVAWWTMNCGRVLGVYDSRLIEYDPSTLAPLGLVVGGDELLGKRILVLASGEARSCRTDTEGEEGMEGAECTDLEDEEQAVLLVSEATGDVTVVQPNEDGSYWRKIVRNKIVRMKEKRRVQAANAYVKDVFDGKADVISSWGPYTQISGTAKNTGVKGLTKK